LAVINTVSEVQVLEPDLSVSRLNDE